MLEPVVRASHSRMWILIGLVALLPVAGFGACGVVLVGGGILIDRAGAGQLATLGDAPRPRRRIHRKASSRIQARSVLDCPSQQSGAGRLTPTTCLLATFTPIT